MLKKIMRISRWFIYNTIFVILAIHAVLYDSIGAKNIVIAITWLSLMIALGICANKEAVTKHVETGFSVPAGVDGVLDFFIFSFFIWNSWFFTGVTYFIGMVLMQVHREEVRKEAALRDKAKQDFYSSQQLPLFE